MAHYQKKIRIDSIIYDDKKLQNCFMNVGKKIRKERMRQNMSISRLAELANLSTSCISKAEAARCQISLKALIKIAAALDVPAGVFLEKAEQAEKEEEAPAPGTGERFEELTADAGEEAVDFVLKMTDELMQVIRNEKKS